MQPNLLQTSLPLSILVTRPDPAGFKLCQSIESQGDHAIHFPTIVFLPPRDEKILQQQGNVLHEQACIIFVSPQAVYSSLSFFKSYFPLPAPIQIAAVGKGTAEALKEAGFHSALYPEEEWGSVGLLQLPYFQSIVNKKIAIICGERGRDLLEKTLQARGAKVSCIVTYRRALPTLPLHFDGTFLKQKKIDVVIGASGESIRNLKILLEKEMWPLLFFIPLIVVSERIKTLAEHLGFQTIWVARNASFKATFEILAERRKEICPIK